MSIANAHNSVHSNVILELILFIQSTSTEWTNVLATTHKHTVSAKDSRLNWKVVDVSLFRSIDHIELKVVRALYLRMNMIECLTWSVTHVVTARLKMGQWLFTQTL